MLEVVGRAQRVQGASDEASRPRSEARDAGVVDKARDARTSDRG